MTLSSATTSSASAGHRKEDRLERRDRREDVGFELGGDDGPAADAELGLEEQLAVIGEVRLAVEIERQGVPPPSRARRSRASRRPRLLRRPSRRAPFPLRRSRRGRSSPATTSPRPRGRSDRSRRRRVASARMRGVERLDEEDAWLSPGMPGALARATRPSASASACATSGSGYGSQLAQNRRHACGAVDDADRLELPLRAARGLHAPSAASAPTRAEIVVTRCSTASSRS